MAPHAEEPNGLANGNGVTRSAAQQDLFTVQSPNVKYNQDVIESNYVYRTTSVTSDANSGAYKVQPKETKYDFRTGRHVGRVGMMLVGWGGNNGTTVTAGIFANKHNMTWSTKEGKQSANYYGSMVMGSTIKLGTDANTGEEVHIPFHNMLPMVHPNDLVIGGWDISGMNLGEAMDRAKVLEPGMKELVRPELEKMKPMPSVYYPDFIAGNQGARADNVLEGDKACWEHVEKIRKDIRDFKTTNNLDRVHVLWTANTERYAAVTPGVNDTASALQDSIKSGHPEIAPSTIFAVASVLENAPFINGSPQNTFVPGMIEFATQHNAFIGGDDFKSGQTKMKSALVDFLISAGIKLTSIASYNHLGNNDGYNLSEHKQFRSKEISKSNVVDDMVAANHVLYKRKGAHTDHLQQHAGKAGSGLTATSGAVGVNEKLAKGELEAEHPDHCVVIKYMPAVGDNKRAMDEYYGEIFCGGHQAISIYNVCEDSLLASPLIIDLVVIADMMTRIQWRDGEAGDGEWKNFHSVLSVLSFMLKAPLTPPGTPVVNALAKQRSALNNIFRAVLGLEPENDMTLEHKLFSPVKA